MVAPYYAGHDSSKLGHPPYLNADQQSRDMMDALTAARKALPDLIQPVQDGGKLLVSGYAQSGHVTMTTHKAMQAAALTRLACSPIQQCRSTRFLPASAGNGFVIQQRPKT